MCIDNINVGVQFSEYKNYPEKQPFHPPEKFPEFPHTECDSNNHLYKQNTKL